MRVRAEGLGACALTLLIDGDKRARRSDDSVRGIPVENESTASRSRPIRVTPAARELSSDQMRVQGVAARQ